MNRFLYRSGLLAGAFVLFAGAAQAQSKTAAGTTVSNEFTLNYSVGGNAQPQIDNSASPTEFTVDRLVDLTVVALDPSVNASPNSAGNVLRYRVTNLGNDNAAFNLTSAVGVNSFTPTLGAVTYFIDLDGDGLLGGGEVLQTFTPGTPTIDITPDASIVVRVAYDVASGTPDAATANIALTAISLFPATGLDPACNTTICPAGAVIPPDTGGNTIGGAAENVLADGAGFSDAANDGAFSANALITVVGPALAATKTVTVLSSASASDAACDALTAPVAGDQYAVPGACIQYVISVTNNGSGEASTLNIADRLSAEVRFIKAELAASTAAGFGDDASVAGTGPSLAAPVAPENCNGTSNCFVNLTDAILAAGNNGQIRIWARVR